MIRYLSEGEAGMYLSLKVVTNIDNCSGKKKIVKLSWKNIRQNKFFDEGYYRADIGDMEHTNSHRYEKMPFFYFQPQIFDRTKLAEFVLKILSRKSILQKKLLDEADIGDMEHTNPDRYEKRLFSPKYLTTNVQGFKKIIWQMYPAEGRSCWMKQTLETLETWNTPTVTDMRKYLLAIPTPPPRQHVYI